MATRKFFITDNHEPISDGVIKSHDKEKLGLAWQNEAPDGHFISGELKGHWIITDEENTLLKEAKKNNK